MKLLPKPVGLTTITEFWLSSLLNTWLNVASPTWLSALIFQAGIRGILTPFVSPSLILSIIRCLAVSLAVCCIERHITLSHSMWGSDQKASLEVHAMDMLNKRIQNVYESLGTGVKYMSESEAVQRKKLRTV